MKTDNPFYSPEHPKNSWELLKWLIFEPNRLEQLDKTLSKKEKLLWFLKAYSWIVLISLLFHLIASGVIVGFNLPSTYPEEFKPDIVKQWKASNNIISNYKIYLEDTYSDMAFGLGFGLAFGLAYSLAFELTVGLIFGLTFGLAVGLVYGLMGGLAFGMIYRLAGGASFGLAFGLAVGLAFGLPYGLAYGLAGGGLAGWLGFGLAGWLGFGLAFYLSYFRLIFYPFYLFRALLHIDLIKNSYLKDAHIWLPLPHLDQKLLAHSWNEPELAFQFADFLLEYRPLQRKLAFEIIHTATAAAWYQNLLIAEKLIFPEIDKENKKAEKLLPSEEWFRLIEKAKSELIAAEKQNHRGFKKDAWQIFHNTLQEFEKTTLLQAGAWKHDYLKAIRRWLEESEKRLKNLELDLQHYESVARNIYRAGESLKPSKFGKETFVGREDLRDDLSFRILSSATMPTFLLQGQRRVGKTSLLNFLPELLGSRFMIIAQDMQRSEFKTVSDCFNGFVQRIKLSENKLSPEPLQAWDEFEAFFKEFARREDRKIILAFDEYENFHRLLKNEGENGERLLAAMRSFSQHQNQVVLLFTGLYLFADLGEPDFSKYFVHAHRLKVGYLKEEDSIKLITNPYPEFGLIYPDELVEEIYRLTVGHPALLQHICYEMVNRANILQKRNMSNEDLQAVLELVLDRDNAVMTNFWKHFCNESLKQTVSEIMQGQKPHNMADLLRLLDYGFIVEDKEQYKLRVPLFEQWIEKHGESF